MIIRSLFDEDFSTLFDSEIRFCDVRDSDFQSIARTTLSDSGRRSREYQIALLECCILCDVFQNGWNVEQHRVGATLLSNLVVDFAIDFDVVRIRNFRLWDELSDRTGSVEGFCNKPGLAPFLQLILKIASRHICKNERSKIGLNKRKKEKIPNAIVYPPMKLNASFLSISEHVFAMITPSSTSK